MSRFPDHFSSVAGDYARFRPRYPRVLFDWLAGLAPRRKLAWDCATGSGQAAVALADWFERVVATDASAAQLASAERHDRVAYHAALAEHSGLATASVDLITVAQALHWFDPPAFYAEVDRVLRPGGLLAVWCYGLFRFTDPAVQALLERFHAEVESCWPPERQLLEAGYRTLDFPFPERVVPSFSMTAVFTLDRLLGYLGTWSAVKGYRAAHGRDPLPSLGRELGEIWGDPDASRPVDWPLALRCGHKPVS